jgi:hypothetical protein
MRKKSDFNRKKKNGIIIIVVAFFFLNIDQKTNNLSETEKKNLLN